MERRRFLLFLAAGLAGASVGRGTAGLVDPDPVPVAAPEPAPDVVPAAADTPARPLPPPLGVVDRLPGDDGTLALTIDDGTKSDVVASLCTFAVDTGVRLTFFPNGQYRSWEENAGLLQPLVDSGQVALGNHTWSHPDVTTLGDDQVAEEIGRNRDFLRATFGVDTPFFRPPFGARNERTDRIAAEAGHPTVVMWNGTLEDHRLLTPQELMGAAREWFAAQAIIVGHANQPTITRVYGELVDLIAERQLRTVTLADVWAPPSLAHLTGTTAGAAIA